MMKFLIRALPIWFVITLILAYPTTSNACTYEEAINSDWSGYEYDDVVRILNEDMTQASTLTDTQKNRCLIAPMSNFYRDFDLVSDGIKYEALCAISALETGYFKSEVCNTYNNVGGLTGAEGYMSFNSKQEGIQALSELLIEEYLSNNGKYYEGKTIVDVSKHYNQNVHWVNTYVKIRLDMEKRVGDLSIENQNLEIEEKEDMSIKLSKNQEEILEKAREAYGARNQLAVAAEECNELAIAVLKFMRYEDEYQGIKETTEKVLEERADVEIILNHIDSLYGFTKEQIEEAMEGKINRLKRWIDTTKDFSYTMVDREVSTKCERCFFYSHPEEAFEKGVCNNCKK